MTKPVRLFLSIFLCVALSSVSVGAGNFVQSPNRDDSSGFPGFFLKRFSRWTIQNIALTSKVIPDDQSAYIETFVKSAKGFGTKTKDGFVRTFDVSVPSTNISPWHLYGTLRLLDLENRAELRELALKLIRQHAPDFDVAQLKGRSIGVGFSGRYNDIEVLIQDDDVEKSPLFKTFAPKAQALIRERPRGIIAVSFKKGKVAEVEITQVGIHAPIFCPPAAHAIQTDRVVSARGDVSYIWHVDQFEPLALSPTGRRIYEDFWRDLNLNPATIRWASPKDYALTYP